MARGAIYVENSDNSKLNGSKPVDSTYSSIKATCPNTCELRDKGCYGQSSFVGMINARLTRRAKGGSPLDLARAEAKAIDNCYGGGKVPAGRFLRLHVVGDAKVSKGVRLINSAVGRWLRRGTNGKAWSYTHCYEKINRKLWNNVSILASVDNVGQVAVARKNGYAPAIIVPFHTSSKAHKLPNCDTTFIPCPNQTQPNGKEIGCSDCQLCFRADWLFATNRGISFAAHGVKQNEIKRRLTVLQ